jgi:hypothetical protein
MLLRQIMHVVLIQVLENSACKLLLLRLLHHSRL